MEPATAITCCLAVLAGAGGLYGLHRLALWLEVRGLLYYRHNKPPGGGLGCLVELQKAVEPRTQHVLHVKENRQRPEVGLPGTGAPPEELLARDDGPGDQQ